MKNIILIGMPASGKTCVGKRVSASLHRPFIDTDELAERMSGKTVAELFAAEGENAFRRLEEEILLSLTEEGGAVVATGGGAVLHEKAMRALKKSGTVFFLDRPLASIEKDMGGAERPLLCGDAEKLRALFAAREKLYRRYADYVLSGGTVEELAETVALMTEMTAED